MDITLERILSLIPKKEDGSYRHRAKSEFARSIGYKDGHIVSMWEGTADDEKPVTSYKDKLFEIAAKYHVSVEWLEGKTDDPTPAGPAAQLDRMIESMSREELAALIVRASELLRDK